MRPFKPVNNAIDFYPSTINAGTRTPKGLPMTENCLRPIGLLKGFNIFVGQLNMHRGWFIQQLADVTCTRF